MKNVKHIQLFKTDFVLIKNQQPIEPLDIIYNVSSVKELFDNGFILDNGESFVSMTELPKNLQKKYLDSIKLGYK